MVLSTRDEERNYFVPTLLAFVIEVVCFVVLNSSDIQFTGGFLDIIQARKTDSVCTSKDQVS